MSRTVTKFYVQARENLRGQTMTEYALILAAVAVACIIAYNTLGTNVSTIATKVANDL